MTPKQFIIILLVNLFGYYQSHGQSSQITYRDGKTIVGVDILNGTNNGNHYRIAVKTNGAVSNYSAEELDSYQLEDGRYYKAFDVFNEDRLERLFLLKITSNADLNLYTLKLNKSRQYFLTVDSELIELTNQNYVNIFRNNFKSCDENQKALELAKFNWFFLRDFVEQANNCTVYPIDKSNIGLSFEVNYFRAFPRTFSDRYIPAALVIPFSALSYGVEYELPINHSNVNFLTSLFATGFKVFKRYSALPGDIELNFESLFIDLPIALKHNFRNEKRLRFYYSPSFIPAINFNYTQNLNVFSRDTLGRIDSNAEEMIYSPLLSKVYYGFGLSIGMELSVYKYHQFRVEFLTQYYFGNKQTFDLSNTGVRFTFTN